MIRNIIFFIILFFQAILAVISQGLVYLLIKLDPDKINETENPEVMFDFYMALVHGKTLDGWYTKQLKDISK